MIVRDFSLKNKFIQYEDIKFEFSKPGIFFLVGENGSGKSSIINSLVFDNNHVEFDTGELKRMYLEERYKLFAYVPQRVNESSLRIKTYLMKDNPNISWGNLEQLLRELGVEYIDVEKPFNTLSGGEQIKCSIACAISKNTPYLFLDEPSNYLDQYSVDLLKEVIRVLSKARTIVIATHDERLLELGGEEYHLDGENVVRKGEPNHNAPEEVVNFTEKHNDRSVNYMGIAIKRISRRENIQMYFLILLVSICLFAWLQYQYSFNYSTDEVPERDMISIYSADYQYGELNIAYCESEGLRVDDNNLYNMVYLEDIESIYALNDCEAVYISDMPKYMEFTTAYNEQEEYDGRSADREKDLIIGLNIFSLPERIYKEEILLNHMGLTEFSYLEEGRLPKDGAKEVAISKRLLKTFFGYSEDSANAAIGDTIEIEGLLYTVVGFEYIDACFISYEDGMSEYGLYKYDSNSFDDFVKYYYDYLEKNDFLYNNVSNVLVVTKFGKEKNVLDELIVKYPANNYYSSEFVMKWVENNNASFGRNNHKVFIPGALLLGLCFLLITIIQFKQNRKQIEDYANYYVGKKELFNSFMTFSLCCCVAVFLLNIIAGVIINRYFAMFKYAVSLNLLCLFLLLMPSLCGLLYSVIRMKGRYCG